MVMNLGNSYFITKLRELIVRGDGLRELMVHGGKLSDKLRELGIHGDGLRKLILGNSLFMVMNSKVRHSRNSALIVLNSRNLFIVMN